MSTFLAEVNAFPLWAQIVLALLGVAWSMTVIVLIGSIDELFGCDYERKQWLGSAGGFIVITVIIVAVWWIVKITVG